MFNSVIGATLNLRLEKIMLSKTQTQIKSKIGTYNCKGRVLKLGNHNFLTKQRD